MHILSLENISKSYGEKILLNNISLGIDESDKIGIIGINGTGKSTLLKIIAGIETTDAGQIIRKNQMRIEYLSQDPEFDPKATVIEQIFKGNSPEMILMRRYESILEKIEVGDMSYNDELLKLQNKIDELHLWELESAAKTVLTKLDIKDFGRQMGVLSGGQRKRVALASALIANSDLLILDEPTNHMDSDSITWLEEYLNRRKGAVIMITHDRYFLDRVTNRIIELDGAKLYSYDGNYSLFVEKKIERDAIEEALERKKQNLYRTELAWIKRGARARSTKQKARIQRFDSLKESLNTAKKDEMDISVLGSRLGKKVIELEQVCKSFEDITCIKNFSYILLRDDRIGILGPNGIGKSTLMNLIANRLQPDSGTVDRGETVKVGYFSQETFHLDNQMRVLDFVREIAEYLPLANGQRISASKMLERFLFPSNLQYSLIGKLSGGEKRRLHLLSVLMEAPNVLLLDEPTNDLDIATLTILEDFIDYFNGPVMAVSHDRYFLDRICEKIFSYKGNGDIEIYPGNYTDYMERIANQAIEGVIKPEQTGKQNYKNKDEKLKFSYKEKIEFEEIDDVIEVLEQKLLQLEEEMEIHATQYTKIQELMEEKAATEKMLEEKMERWSYLNVLAEKIEEQKNKQ
ncbi:ABC-F family ATP-binding cassette domain-containing protein [Vallitalea okinawensis]|uniref:ABC-F family ATP-binding cassette domain-containing protein n=1 Tax=Vallitalea okinawensis TaxID=2078660 RepID=UPI000CFD9BA5|nr:ABC-F family ATP-binding cassette domain-containing protein [Vallitalea okinawensis]